MRVALLCLLLAGCTSLPSLQYCDRVSYERIGSHVELAASCSVPIGINL
jgi:hypothetical protein